MNPNRESGQFNYELPPQPETHEGEEVRGEHGLEAAPAPQEKAGRQAPPPALPAIPDDIPAVDTPVIGAAADDAAARPVPDSSAKDAERIEPAWVNKAKEIIAQTHDDPYLQKDQMSKVKADYIAKRFGKQIKTEGTK